MNTKAHVQAFLDVFPREAKMWPMTLHIVSSYDYDEDAYTAVIHASGRTVDAPFTIVFDGKTGGVEWAFQKSSRTDMTFGSLDIWPYGLVQWAEEHGLPRRRVLRGLPS